MLFKNCSAPSAQKLYGSLSEESFNEMSEVIRDFVSTKDFFEKDYLLGDDCTPAFDYVELM